MRIVLLLIRAVGWRWIREFVGWAVTTFGLGVLCGAYRLAKHGYVIGAGPLATTGFVLVLLGIHQVKVAAATAYGEAAAAVDQGEQPRANPAAAILVAAAGVAVALAVWTWGLTILSKSVSLLGWTGR